MDQRTQDASTLNRWLALCRAGQSGDREALERLLDEVRPFLKQVVLKRMGGQHFGNWDASDVVQDVLAKLTHSGSELRGSTGLEFVALLRKMACHEFFDKVRHDEAAKRGGGDKPRPLPHDSTGAVQVAGDTSTPSQRAVRNEASSQLEAALKQLSEATQEVIRLRCFEKQEWSEIAQRTARTEAAVQQLYWRGQKRLKQLMGAEA
jgi:RNA polymerase sigma-70 factor (ECF subfamily)